MVCKGVCPYFLLPEKLLRTPKRDGYHYGISGYVGFSFLADEVICESISVSLTEDWQFILGFTGF